MSRFTVWIVNELVEQDPALLDYLLGNFPTRLLRSSSSVESVLRLPASSEPNVCLYTAPSGALLQQGFVDDLVSDSNENFLRARCGIVEMNGNTCDASSSDHEVYDFKAKQMYSLPHWLNYLAKATQTENRLIVGDIVFFPERNVFVQEGTDEESFLSHKESKILVELINQPKKALEKSKLIETIWYGSVVSPRSLDTHVSRLRKKLKDTEIDIQSIYGQGYCLRRRSEL